MGNKFSKLSSKFDDVRNKLKQKRDADEARKSGGGFDDSYKFAPKLPANKTKIQFVVRILPNIHEHGNGEPWLTGNFHMFRKPDGKFVYALCPSTFEDKAPCPICEKAAGLFNTGDERDKDSARDFYKKRRTFVNVLIVADPRDGEENQTGQVLVWEFGKTIFEKLEEALLDDGIDFANPLEGNNFELIIKKKGDYPNYDSSRFASEETPIDEDDEKMDEVFGKIHKLEEKAFRKGAPTYDKLNEMLTGEAPKNTESVTDSDESPDSVDEDDEDDEENKEEEVAAKKETKPKAAEAKAKAPAPKGSSDSDDSEDEDDEFEFDFDDEED